MPIASKNFAEFELKRTNQTLGTNLVLGKNGNGYTLYTDETRTSEINCCMTFNQVTTALATMRRLFEYKKDLIPWAWGLNGYMSVVGSALSIYLSHVVGLNWFILLACALYMTLVFIPQRGLFESP